MTGEEKQLLDLINEIARQAALLRQRGKIPRTVYLSPSDSDRLGMDSINGLTVISRPSITDPKVK